MNKAEKHKQQMEKERTERLTVTVEDLEAVEHRIDALTRLVMDCEHNQKASQRARLTWK